MRASLIASIFLLAAAPSPAENDPLVVMAAARKGMIAFFDAALSPLPGIGVNPLLESVTASPDGRRLYVAQENRRGAGDCCGLFSLDLETRKMCRLVSPALFASPSPDSRYLFTQGKSGVDVFDAESLNRVSTMKAPGAYNLQPSPDGRWLLGVTNSPQPSLDVFNLNSRLLSHRLPLPIGPVTGAWAGDRFYLFAYGARGMGQLWSVNPEHAELSAPAEIALPDLHGACNEPVLLMLTGAPGQLFLAEAFGFKVDRRLNCPDAARDGVYVIHPSSGRVSHIATSLRVNRMAVSPDGHDLYVIHSSGPSPLSNRLLVRIDAASGRVMKTVPLDTGEWNLSLAHIPHGVLPLGWTAAVSCTR